MVRRSLSGASRVVDGVSGPSRAVHFGLTTLSSNAKIWNCRRGCGLNKWVRHLRVIFVPDPDGSGREEGVARCLLKYLLYL